jgi:hypothetical protein
VQRRKAFKEDLNLEQYGGASDREDEEEVDAKDNGQVKVYKGAQLTSTVTVAPMKINSSDSELSTSESDVEEEEGARGSRPHQPGGGHPGPDQKDTHGKKLGKGALKAMESIKMKLAGKKVKKKKGKKRDGNGGGTRGGRGGGRGGKSRGR